MKDYVILSDFTCDISHEAKNDFGIEDIIRGHIHMDDGREFPSGLEWDSVPMKEYYAALSDKKRRITTAPPSPAEYYEVFKQYAKQDIAILSISLSSRASSTYTFCCQGAERLKAEYPDAKIYCLDSYRMSGALGLLVLYAQKLKNEGKSFEENIEWLEANKTKIHQMGPIDDLFFIARRGRITMGKAIMGSFAGVKPLGDCNNDGYASVLTKVKGISRAFDVTVKYVKETAVDISNQYIILAHSDRELYAESLKEKLENELHPKKIYVTDVHYGCGANIGPGMIAVYYFGNEISEDMCVEKDVMNKIIGK